MVGASFMHVFTFVLVMVLALAGVAFVTSQKSERRFGNALLESGIWGLSLIACAGADYLLMMLSDTHSWV